MSFIVLLQLNSDLLLPCLVEFVYIGSANHQLPAH